jgi:hypothetical protein
MDCIAQRILLASVVGVIALFGEPFLIDWPYLLTAIVNVILALGIVIGGIFVLPVTFVHFFLDGAGHGKWPWEPK